MTRILCVVMAVLGLTVIVAVGQFDAHSGSVGCHSNYVVQIAMTLND